MHLISVDFPAPLSPSRPTTSPRLIAKLTLFTATKPPKRFVMFLTERSGSVMSSAPRATTRNQVARLVDQHGDNDDRTDHDELPESLDVEHHQPGRQDRDDEGPDYRPYHC